MRLVEVIPHAQCRISIMSYNDKWIIEIEAAQYKQTYKIGHDNVSGLEDVRKLITPGLIGGTLERFRSMHGDFAHSFQQLQNPSVS